MLREHLWSLRQTLEQKEVQVTLASQQLVASLQEGDVIAGKMLALVQRYPQAVGRSLQPPQAPQVMPVPAPVLAVPAPVPLPAPAPQQDGAPPTPGSSGPKHILSLQQTTPGPRSGTYALDAPPTVSPMPSPSGVRPQGPWTAPPTPHRAMFPPTPPPTHPAPNLSPVVKPADSQEAATAPKPEALGPPPASPPRPMVQTSAPVVPPETPA